LEGKTTTKKNKMETASAVSVWFFEIPFLIFSEMLPLRGRYLFFVVVFYPVSL